VRESVIWAGEWRRGLFSSYGMGGLVNVELTPEFCARLGAAFGAMMPKGAAVAVTRDRSRSSRMIKRAIVAGVVSAGARVRDLSALPVPVTQYATKYSECAAGLHVLASPLDQRSADIRFFDGDGLQLDKRGERRLENLFFREDFRRASFYEMGEIEYATPLSQYAAHVLSTVDADAIRAAGFRLLIDYDYSSASIVLPEILDALNVSAMVLHAGFSEDHQPRAAYDEAAMITRSVGADFGCVLNASGERLIIVDDMGTALSSHQAIGVISAMLLVHTTGIIMAPASVPQWVGAVVENHDGTPLSAKGDPASVLRAAISSSALVGCDGEGGFIWPGHLGAYDAVYTVVKLLELRAHADQPMSVVRGMLPKSAYLTASEFCPWEVKGRVMRVLLEEHRDQQLDLADGIKVMVDGGFVLVTPDPDAPAYRIVASVEDEASGRRLLEEYAKRVRDAQNGGGERPSAEAVLGDHA
jgi:mannose-1-phosphate guanylyltransferase/phosphomannomutase